MTNAMGKQRQQISRLTHHTEGISSILTSFDLNKVRQPEEESKEKSEGLNYDMRNTINLTILESLLIND